MTIAERFNHITAWVVRLWKYCSSGVWNDTGRGWRTTTVKTLNLSVRSFLDGDLQTQACAMTYRTLLAIVPALALLFAIGRGFGFQNLLQDELYSYFPAQHEVIHQCLGFVDSYLSQASEGVFVGVGLVFLLWTLISLLGNVEDVFNTIWGVKQGRSIWRKITDYTSMLLILPVLMICSGGLSVLISTTLNSIFHFSFMTPIISMILDGASWLLTFLFFTAAYMLIPNAKVKFKNAFIAGVFAGIGFRLLQWIFVTGQMYVAKYNATVGANGSSFMFPQNTLPYTNYRFQGYDMPAISEAYRGTVRPGWDVWVGYANAHGRKCNYTEALMNEMRPDGGGGNYGGNSGGFDQTGFSTLMFYRPAGN